MEIWVILALVVAVAEIFGKKNQKKQPPKPTQMPEDYQEYDYEENSYEENSYNQEIGRQKPYVEPVERPMQEKSTGLPKWLEEAMKKAAMETTGKGAWQDMVQAEPIAEKPKPITIQQPVVKAGSKVNKSAVPSSKAASVSFKPSPKIVIQETCETENNHHVFEGKTMQDIKQVIVMSELLGPPLALRKGRRLI